MPSQNLNSDAFGFRHSMGTANARNTQGQAFVAGMVAHASGVAAAAAGRIMSSLAAAGGLAGEGGIAGKGGGLAG